MASAKSRSAVCELSCVETNVDFSLWFLLQSSFSLLKAAHDSDQIFSVKIFPLCFKSKTLIKKRQKSRRLSVSLKSTFWANMHLLTYSESEALSWRTFKQHAEQRLRCSWTSPVTVFTHSFRMCWDRFSPLLPVDWCISWLCPPSMGCRVSRYCAAEVTWLCAALVTDERLQRWRRAVMWACWHETAG